MRTPIKNDYRLLFRLAGWSFLALMLYTIATLLIVSFIGGPPETPQEIFVMLRTHRINGLLRLDVLTMFVMPLYFVIFYAIHVVLKDINHTLSALSTIFIFTGVTLFLASPSVFSYLRLSDAFQAATSETEKIQLLAATEAILATDIWHGTGPRIGGLLVQLGATTLSILMMRSKHFSLGAAYTGIITHGLDLLHIIAGFFIPLVANVLMAMAGILYLVWFPLMMLSFFELANRLTTTQQNL